MFLTYRSHCKSYIQLIRQRLSKKNVKAYATMPKGSKGKKPIIHIALHFKSAIRSRDYELLLKFSVYFPDYHSALSRTLLHFLDNRGRNSCNRIILMLYLGWLFSVHRAPIYKCTYAQSIFSLIMVRCQNFINPLRCKP